MAWTYSNSFTQVNDYSAKDALATDDPEKIILGADIDAEFAAIIAAYDTKLDSGSVSSGAEAAAGTDTESVMTPANVTQWADSATAGAGMVGDIWRLADPNADMLLGWDDSAGAVIGFTCGTGLTQGPAGALTTIALSHLGLEDLTDPGADRILFWDDATPDALAWLTVGNGLEISTTTLGITDVTAGAAQPVVITSGTFTFDLSSITTMSIEDLNVAQDGVVMSDNGTIKVLPADEAGVDVIEVANASQTFALTDANTYQLLTGLATSNKTWTVPTNAAVAFKIGTTIMFGDRDKQATYNLIIAASSGVTLTSYARDAAEAGGGEADHTVLQGGTGMLVKVATDQWMVMGDIT